MTYSDSNVSRETSKLLSEYVTLLKKWNKKINLISKASEHDIWDRHIFDSSQLMNFIDVKDHVIDIGSGSGMPGLVLALMGVENVVLIESDGKKASFLLRASELSPYNVTVLNARAETLDLECDVLVSRALASVKDIFNLCHGYRIKKKIVLLKGMKVLFEIEDAGLEWHFTYRLHPSAVQKDGWILEIEPGFEKK